MNDGNVGVVDIQFKDAMPQLTIKVRLVGIRATLFRVRLGMFLVKLASKVLRSDVLIDADGSV